MGVYKEVNFVIKGDVPAGYEDRDYEVLKAELKLVCAKYGLQLEEE